VIAKGDLEQGSALLQEALRRDPGNLAAVGTLLKLSLAQNKTADVVKRISDLQDRDPDTAGLRFLLALGQYSLRDLDHSEANVKRVIAQDPHAGRVPAAWPDRSRAGFAGEGEIGLSKRHRDQSADARELFDPRNPVRE
jgi:hypothetical protein